VESGLGQPLSARVELTAAQKDELDTLSAKVADPSVYRDNNVQYPSAMSRARVTVEQGPNNQYYLKISTQQAVNEPFLDLIVEVNWATGRVVRNYTFLLDPPGASDTQAVEPVAPVRAAAAPARGTSQRATAGSAAGPKAGAGDSYTVKRGDTLSKIAKEYKPADVTLEQELVALFRSNEAMFDGKNMNRLRSGQILTIPSADQPGQIAPSDAKQVVRVQAADWRAYRDRLAAAAPTTEATPSRQAAGGKITTAVEEKGAPAPSGRDQLKVSREQGKGSGAGASVAQAEDAAAKDKALREANSRIADLEKTLKDMQKATELKSQTMSDMQKQADATKAAKVAEPVKAEPPTVVAAAPAAPPAPIATPATPQAATPEAKPAEAKAPETTPAETKAPEAKAPEAPAPAAAAETKAPETKPAPAPKATKAKAPPPAPSFLDDLLANTPSWALIAGPLVVLGGIAAILAARRRKTTKFEDSIISGTDIKTNTVFGSTGGGVVNTGDNSLASDFSREGLGSIDTDEVDPIAEAEVYLAYGRDAQAEEILKEALKKDPQRQEIYLKLLEIHAQHNKPSAFETVASELYSVSGGQGEVWQKAMALGRQLDPSNPMFTEAGSAAAFAAAAAAESEHSASEKDVAYAAEPVATAPVFSAPPEAKAEPRITKPMDLALDEEISVSPTSGAAPDAKSPAAILAGAAEQVAKSTRTSAAAGVAAVAGGAAALAKSFESKTAAPREDVSFEPESIPKFDLDFNLDEPTRPTPPVSASAVAAAKPAPKPAAPEPVLAALGPTTTSPAPQLARPAAAIELDKLDLAFDPQRSTFEDPTPSVLDGQWHDAATKLDLAKAYQEMGDVEGAREILQEVLHEGDDQQKAEAQGLLAKLA
jgi:pilus assembly protein FimV